MTNTNPKVPSPGVWSGYRFTRNADCEWKVEGNVVVVWMKRNFAEEVARSLFRANDYYEANMKYGRKKPPPGDRFTTDSLAVHPQKSEDAVQPQQTPGE